MLKRLTLALVLAWAGWAGAAMAQDDTTTAEDETPATEESPFNDLGEAEGADPGGPFIRDVFGDWALRCIRGPEGDDQCQLYQLLLGPDATPIAEVSLVPLLDGGEAAAGAVVVVPLETLLTQKLTLRVDGGEGRRYDFDFCNLAGCVARFGLTASQVEGFKRGALGTLEIVPAGAPDQRITLDMSLAGFTAGYTAMEEQLQ